MLKFFFIKNFGNCFFCCNLPFLFQVCLLRILVLPFLYLPFLVFSMFFCPIYYFISQFFNSFISLSSSMIILFILYINQVIFVRLNCFKVLLIAPYLSFNFTLGQLVPFSANVVTSKNTFVFSLENNIILTCHFYFGCIVYMYVFTCIPYYQMFFYKLFMIIFLLFFFTNIYLSKSLSCFPLNLHEY